MLDRYIKETFFLYKYLFWKKSFFLKLTPWHIIVFLKSILIFFLQTLYAFFDKKSYITSILPQYKDFLSSFISSESFTNFICEHKFKQTFLYVCFFDFFHLIWALFRMLILWWISVKTLKDLKQQVSISLLI
jgi:hypothetical protein